ncbi:MAG: winged helix-turn-helix domain-containing protein [Candidatus Bathyarchaeia archaeon]
MSSGLASLHKILKDETRRKAVLLLSQKGVLSYTELMDELGIASTGLLNYHLKVLGDLLAKNEAGQYSLTERGKLAARFLTEFPDESKQLEKRKRQRIFWTAAGISQIIILFTVWILHSTGYVDFANAVRSTVAAISGVALAYLGYRMWSNGPEGGSIKEKLRMKIGYTVGGAGLILFIGFFGPVLLTLISTRLGGPNIFRVIDASFGGTLYFFLLLFVLMPIGGIGGYYLGKRNGFSKPRWATWLDEKFGFY